MNKESNDITKQRNLNFIFTFECQSSDLIIKAKHEDTQYQGKFESNPFVPFDDVIKMLESSQFEVVENNFEKVRIRLGGLVYLNLVNQQKVVLNQLQETVKRLTGKIQNESEKNRALQQIVRLQQTQISSLEKKLLSFDLLQQKLLQHEKIIKELSQKAIRNEVTQNELQKTVKTLENNFKNIEGTQKQHQTNQQKLQLIKKAENHQITALNTKFNSLSSKFNTLLKQTLPKFIPYDNFFFAGSEILEYEGQKSRVRGFFPNKRIRSVYLLYRASDNEFSVAKFHELCDGISNTLFLCETQFDRKCGGFTPLTWETDNPNGEFKADHSKESFIFSVSCDQRFQLHQPQNAIFAKDTLGPTFGKNNNSHDLWILDRADKQKNNGANICGSYQNARFKKDQQPSWERFCGNKKNSHEFRVTEWEVWKVEFSQ